MVVENGATGGESGGQAAGGAESQAVGGGAAGAAPQDTGAAGAAGQVLPGAGQQAGGAAPAAYTPNFKYKVLKEEREIPEWARGIVKSADVEKQVRDLFERADGLESVKQHRDVLVQENQVFREQVLPFYQEAQQALNFARQGDLDSFFNTVGIPEVAILKYALHRLQLRDKPEALAAHNEMVGLRQQNLTLQQQVELAQQQARQVATAQKETELQTTLGRPEILSAVQAFDARMGKPGAFRAEVIRRAQMMHAATGQDPTAEQAVGEMLRLIGWNGGETPAAQAAQPPAQNGAVNAGAVAGGTAQAPGAGAKPTLPNIRGRGTSPAKSVPKSVDELRKLAREKMAL